MFAGVINVAVGFANDEVRYAGEVGGAGEFGSVGGRTGFPVLDFYFKSVGRHCGGWLLLLFDEGRLMDVS